MSPALIKLGGVTVRVRHVAGDHASDSCVLHVEPDRVLFLGDCLYEAPSGGYTAERAQPLLETVLRFGAEIFIEGHLDDAYGRAELEQFLEQVRAAVAG